MLTQRGLQQLARNPKAVPDINFAQHEQQQLVPPQLQRRRSSNTPVTARAVAAMGLRPANKVHCEAVASQDLAAELAPEAAAMAGLGWWAGPAELGAWPPP